MDIKEMREHIREFQDAGGHPIQGKVEEKFNKMTDEEIKEWYNNIMKATDLLTE